MVEYVPGPFAAIARTESGRSIWNYLTSDEAIDALEATAFLGRSALEGLQLELDARFSRRIAADSTNTHRWKQMMGHMVRQIMAQRGCGLIERDYPIKVGSFFKTAARYA